MKTQREIEEFLARMMAYPMDHPDSREHMQICIVLSWVLGRDF
jgi:hypothetical protein